jgi:hypothetical protein
MMRIRFLPTLLALCTMLGCAGAGPRPEWAAAPDANLPALATFTWADLSEGAPRTVLDTQVRNALGAELATKGYEESREAPEFLVSYELIEHETARGASPVRIGIGMGTWSGRVGGSVGTSVGVGGGDPDLRYRLTIRALDRERSRELWIGATTTFQLPADARTIERAVSGVMRGFPARRN